MYQIGICSNDKAAADRLRQMYQHTAKIYVYLSENELWDEIVHDALQSDILIISICNQNKKSIESARKLQAGNKDVIIIFLLESAADISNIVELEPAYLLMEPAADKNLCAVIDKAIQRLEEKKLKMLQLCFKDRMLQIPYQEILYIESDRRYIDIHYSGKTERVLMKLDVILEKLPDYFVRCHQSYVVNIRRITKWEKHTISIGQDIHIPISRNRMQETKENIYKYYN